MAAMKTQKSRGDTAVQGTNDSSIVSKCSMSEQGYFRDDFLKCFVTKSARRAPIINRGYYIRARAVDCVFRNFLQQFGKSQNQVVSLGAGFDSSYFRLKADGCLTNTVYYEVDFPDLVKRKRQLIELYPKLNTLLDPQYTHQTSNAELNSADYKLVGVDLTQLDCLTRSLEHVGVDWSVPTLLLSEVVLTYMPPKSANAVISWAATTFENAVFALYEQIIPRDGFGYFMQNHFTKLGSTLKCLNTFPDKMSQQNRFLTLGWHTCAAMDMNEFYHQMLSVEEHNRVDKLEPFDEFEEWHLKCAHYTIVIATRGRLGHTMASQLRPFVGLTPTSACEGTAVEMPNHELLQAGSCEGTAVEMPNHELLQAGSCSVEENVSSIKQLVGNETKANLDSDIKDSNASIHYVNLASCDSQNSIRIFGHTATLMSSGLVVILGGFAEKDKKHSRMKDLMVYDYKCQKLWTVDPFESSASRKDLCERMYHSVCNLGDDRLFVWGGRTSPIKPCVQACLIKIERTLSPVESNVVPTAETNNSLPNVCSSSLGNAVTTKTINNRSLVEESIKGSCEVVNTSGEAPCPRWRHKAAFIKKNGESYVVVFGGRTVEKLALCDCYMLNVQTWTWSKVTQTGSIPEACHSHTLDVYEGTRLLLAGGLTAQGVPLNTLYSLCTDTWVWTRLHLSAGTLLPRYSHTSALLKDSSLILVGGVNHVCPSPGVAVIDIQNHTCQEYPLPPMVPEDLWMLHNHASVQLTENDDIMILGGGGNCFSFGTHFNAHPLLASVRINMDQLT